MLTCLAIMGQMFISDGSTVVALEHIGAARIEARGNGKRVMEVGRAGIPGSISLDISSIPVSMTALEILAACADSAEIAGLEASIFSSPD